jgi:hypothetical protein
MTYVRRSHQATAEVNPLPRKTSQSTVLQSEFKPSVVTTSEVYFVTDVVESVETSVDVEVEVNVVEPSAAKSNSSTPFDDEEVSLPAIAENEIDETVKPASTSSRSSKRKG